MSLHHSVGPTSARRHSWRPVGRALRPYVTLMRIPQWAKNGFVVLPAFFDPHAISRWAILRVALGVACFCLVSSGVYVLNDFVDRERDRKHPRKRLRPLAAGHVASGKAAGLGIVLVVFGFGGALPITRSFGAIVGAYLAINVAYSVWLKDVSILDIFCIAFGFVLRVEGGGALIGVWPSPWMVICSGLLALFLATAKRRDDVIQDLDHDHRASLRGYSRGFLDASLTVFLGAAAVSYCVYTTDVQVRERLHTDQLYLTIPFVLAGCMRYLQIIFVEERAGSPVDVLYRDGFILSTIAGWIATCWIIIYF